MIYISHRGNLNGKVTDRENTPSYIDEAISSGFDVEVDVWFVENQLFLGHDYPITPIHIDWLNRRKRNLWIHCKNIQALEYMESHSPSFNYFWHETDTVTLTSMQDIWAFPGKQPIKNSIAVLPEIHNDTTDSCLGICSDFIQRYKNNETVQ